MSEGKGSSGRVRAAIERASEQAIEKLDTGRLGRAAKLSKLAFSGGKRAFVDRAKRAMGREVEDDRRVGIAAEMLETFSRLRGVSMKLGQMLSYVDDALPPEARKVLSVLQKDVAPMQWEAVKTVIDDALAAPIDSVFSEFDQTPVAAASIGQVHRARLLDGTEVAVKVQYPGMAEAMRSDLANAKILGVLQRMLAFSTDSKAIMAELEQRFMDECDYRKEAAYQETYYNRFQDHPVIVVPRVFRSLCRDRILVTEFFRGKNYHDWLDETELDQRQAAVRSFYRFYLGSFYMDGLFNCDPHPGNYLFLEGGRIVFLDYGCCRQFEPDRLRLWIELCQAVCASDREALRRLAVQLNFVNEGVRYDEEAFRELINYLYEPYLEDAPFAFADHRPENTFRRMFMENKNLFKLNMPSDAVFLNRIGFGLVSLMAEMGGVLNVRAYVDSYIQGIDPDWPEDPFRSTYKPAADSEG